MTGAQTHPTLAASGDDASDASRPKYMYAVTAQTPTITSHSVVCHFTSATSLNLIVAKSTRLEIFQLTQNGCEPVISVPIYGRIADMCVFRNTSGSAASGASTNDRLFLCTERHQFCVLAYDSVKSLIVTLANGTVRHSIGRPADAGQRCLVDPLQTCIGLHQYDGLFQIIPIESTAQLHDQAYDLRLEELFVKDLCFLHSVDAPVKGKANKGHQPSLCVLYCDAKELKHIKTYAVDVADKDLKANTDLSFKLSDETVTHLVAVAALHGGLVAVGEEAVYYYSMQSAASCAKPISIALRPTQVTVVSALDANRYLIGDLAGNLLLLILKCDAQNKVQSLHLESLGQTSSPSTLSYLDSGYVYVGSTFGDSCLVKLSADRQADGSYLQLIDEHTNLGSIVDMCLVDQQTSSGSGSTCSTASSHRSVSSGQGRLVTCSGAYNSGSLRIVRNGIGVTEEASIDLPNCQRLFSLRADTAAKHCTHLVQSFVGETRVLGFDADQSLAELPIAGFDQALPTLHCATVANDCWLQVTQQKVTLVDCKHQSPVAQWQPPAGAAVTVATASDTVVLAAMTGSRLAVLDVSGRAVRQVALHALDNDVSCVALYAHAALGSVCYAALGMWNDLTVRLLRIDTAAGTVQQLQSLKLQSEIMSRSLCFSHLSAPVAGGASSTQRIASQCWLLCGLGDGALVYFDFNVIDARLSGDKKLQLGSQAITLHQFDKQHTDDKTSASVTSHVFACCDRPCVISSQSSKIVFAPVNLGSCVDVCDFRTTDLGDCLALCTVDQLMIGAMEKVQKMHVQKVPLNGQPRRIAYQAQSQTCGVLLVKQEAQTAAQADAMDVSSAVAMRDVSYLQLFDSNTFALCHSFALDDTEQGAAILSCRLTEAPVEHMDMSDDKPSNDALEYYVVGTSYVNEGETEPSLGRLLIFGVVQQGDERQLQLVYKHRVKGAVYCLAQMNPGNLIVAGINSKTCVFRPIVADSDHSATDMSVATSLKLQLECTHGGNLVVLDVAVSGSYILVADVMKSISLLLFKDAHADAHSAHSSAPSHMHTSILEQVARDHDANWMLQCSVVGADTFLGCDSHCNIFTARRPLSQQAAEDDFSKLEITGRYHLGEFVNKLLPGTIVMQMPDVQSSSEQQQQTSAGAQTAVGEAVPWRRLVPCQLYGSVNGTIGVLAPLSHAQYKFLRHLEDLLETMVFGAGDLQHREWRAFANDRKYEESSSGWIDGDLIEAFLDLTPERKIKICSALKLPVEEVTQRIEQAQRIH